MPVTAAAMWNPTNPTAITASDIAGDASLRPSQARTSPNSTPGTTKKASSLRLTPLQQLDTPDGEHHAGAPEKAGDDGERHVPDQVAQLEVAHAQ